jgi:hypothetical protein
MGRRQFAEALECFRRAEALDPPAERRSSTCPLRAAYLSAFFASRNWMKPVWSLVNEHDRDVLAVHLLSEAAMEDEVVDPVAIWQPMATGTIAACRSTSFRSWTAANG